MSRSFASFTSLAALLPVATIATLAACSSGSRDSAARGDENDLQQKADEHWFYTGSLPKLDDAKITVSIAGHTAHVTGFVPAATTLPNLPHLKTKAAGPRTQLDIVYPIATAGPGSSDSRNGTYSFYQAKPYRPDGAAYTPAEGDHFVPWGGFPFLAYNGGIALHGPITDEANQAASGEDVWYLRRGNVSHGCNRMLGEHVIELANLIGVPMRRVYDANHAYDPTAPPMDVTAKVTVTNDYDELDGKYIDVDYATDTGAVRPGKVYGDDKVTMFGSWIGSETPDGKDLPRNMKWEGGVSGTYYVFAEHALPNIVCSIPKANLPELKKLATSYGGELPASLCEKKACIVNALSHGGATAVRGACGI